MSSPPDNPAAGGRKRVPFEAWRKVMLIGAFILLGGAVANAVIDGRLPDWANFGLTFFGYGFLAAGFGMRMRGLREARERKAAEVKAEGATPISE